MSFYRWIPWEQPKLQSNTDYGIVSASSENIATAEAYPWKASDGIKSGNTTSWEAAKEVLPASWLWEFPVTLKITKLILYNKYSSFTNVTKDVAVFSDAEQTKQIAEGTFAAAPFSTLEFTFDDPVITNQLCVLCINGYNTSGRFLGLGEVEITAEEGIIQYSVEYVDWDSTVLKAEIVDRGASVTPPADPVRKGYVFKGWSAKSDRVVSDMLISAVYEKIPVETDYLLTTLTDLLNGQKLPVETGVFKGKAPDKYIVLTPLTDTFELFADNRPQAEIQEVRISLYDKGNYLKTKNEISRALLDSDITITDRRYIGHEDNTGYYHYAIDVAKQYNFEEE